jgi:hypothetical protein
LFLPLIFLIFSIHSFFSILKNIYIFSHVGHALTVCVGDVILALFLSRLKNKYHTKSVVL